MAKKIITEKVKALYSDPQIYIPTTTKRNKPDISKDWYVFYRFYNPATKLRHRFKIYEDINSFKTIASRMESAQAWETVYRELLEGGLNPYSDKNTVPGDSSTFLVSLESYLKEAKKTVAPSTLSIMESRITKLYDYGKKKLGANFRMADVTGQLITDCVDDLFKRKVINTGKTANMYKGMISTFFNFYLLKEGQTVVTVNPTKFVTAHKVIPNGNLPFNDKEWKTFLEYTAAHVPLMNKMVRFIYYSCMRNVKEIRNCQVKHLLIEQDINKSRIAIPPENSKLGHIDKKTVYIPLDPMLYEMLRDEMHVFDFPDDYYIFSASNKGPGVKPICKSYFQEYTDEARRLKKLGKDNTLYSAKHTRCCHLFLDGMPQEQIIKLTRHKDLLTLQIYLRGMNLLVDELPVFKSRAT